MACIFLNEHKQQYSLLFRKFAQANLPPARFELRFLGLQASALPIEPPLLVTDIQTYN